MESLIHGGAASVSKSHGKAVASSTFRSSFYIKDNPAAELAQNFANLGTGAPSLGKLGKVYPY